MEEQCCNSIVSERLSETNYADWSLDVEQYLMGRDLWDIVVRGDEQRLTVNVWKQKNAAALHAILISCSPRIRRMINDVRSAGLAWTILANKLRQPNSLPTHVRSDYVRYGPLFKAVYRGDWDTAKPFLDQHPEAVKVKNPGRGETVLHVAVTEEHLHIVRGLMDVMTEQEIEIERNDGHTALGAAIKVGNLDIAKCLVRKNRRLVSIFNRDYGLPVTHAVVSGQKKNIIHYLYSATPVNVLTQLDRGRSGASLLADCILMQHFDIALDLLKRAPYLAITEIDGGEKSPVCALANSDAFRSGCTLTFWQQWIYDGVRVPDSVTNFVRLDIQNLGDNQTFKPAKFIRTFTRCKEVMFGPVRWGWSYIRDLLDIDGTREMRFFHAQTSELLKQMCKVIEDISDEAKITQAGVHDALREAARAGNGEFITSIAKANPPLAWNSDIARIVFEEAVQHRQAKIFNLIYGLRDKTAIVSFHDEDSNMLHKAAAMAPLRLLKLIPGAALQMQSELQWFKAVEELASPAARQFRNKEYLKPRALFTENHKELVVEGERWMKDTAGSSTVVGALIVTVTFAASFTFPGGNDQNNGFPMFLESRLFKVFMMSNAVALFTSTMSVLMFLGILTSRYGEGDFLKSLPTKLIFGISTLFLSIAAMIIAFCAGISQMFHRKLWIVAPCICFACITVSFFVLMQFRLLVDIFLYTYGPSIFKKNAKRWI